MNTHNVQRIITMSFSLWPLDGGDILEPKSRSQPESEPARMHPQSKGGPVLGLHSCRALSPGPRPEPEPAGGQCHLPN